LNAAHHGVPQNRQRLFLMGARKGFALPEYPEATHEVYGDADTGSLFRRSTPTV
jgi:site-specific DNA-cytosine methylase